MRTRRSSISSSGETTISVCASKPWSRRRNPPFPREDRLVGFGPFERRLMSSRPELLARVADVTEGAPAVAGGPALARDREVLPAAVALPR
jgi:hypothetical protein